MCQRDLQSCWSSFHSHRHTFTHTDSQSESESEPCKLKCLSQRVTTTCNQTEQKKTATGEVVTKQQEPRFRFLMGTFSLKLKTLKLYLRVEATHPFRKSQFQVSAQAFALYNTMLSSTATNGLCPKFGQKVILKHFLLQHK